MIQTLQGYAAFIPAPLAPKLAFTEDLVLALSRADVTLATLSELALLDALFANPFLPVARAARILRVSNPTARQVVRVLQEEGILREITGRAWGRVHLARPILRAIEGDGVE